MENTAITFITYIDTMQEKLKCIYDEINKVSNIPEVIDHIDDIRKIVISLDQYNMLSIRTCMQLLYECKAKFSTLYSLRQVLLERISNKNSAGMQTDITTSFYDESCLIHHIDVSKCVTNKPIQIDDIIVNPLDNPKDYSCVALINRFVSEGPLLTHITQICTSEFNRIIEGMNGPIRNSITELKNVNDSINFIESILANNDKANEFIKQIDQFISKNIKELINVKNAVTKIHQLCIILTENYAIYDKAVTSYTTLTMESFFDKDAPYEIC